MGRRSYRLAQRKPQRICPSRSPDGCGQPQRLRLSATTADWRFGRRGSPRYAWPVTRPLPRDPLLNTTKLLVDGTNLLHALTSGPGDRQPPAAVIGRLRGAIPPETAITL